MNVLWYPSYGSEMRGGTANCTIKFSDKEIASPCAKKIDILMAMNAPAIDKFESSLRPGGLLLVNSSLVHEREYRDDIKVVKVPMTEIAAEHENPKGANIVMMGAMAANSDLFTEDDLERLTNEFFEKKGKINPKNSLCFRAGELHGALLMKSAPGALPGSAPGKSRSGGVNFLNVLDVIIILAYFVGMIVLGLIANKKQTGVDDYYLGGRSMGALKIGALWMAGWIGGSSVIGTSSNSYSMGITGVWYVGEIAIGCVLFALVMAKPIKRVSDELRNVTFPELIHARYDQKNSTMASITTILAMIGYTAAQFVAGASILNVLTGWNLGVCYILAAVVIVFYVSTGGLLAVTYTDIVQMALLLLGVVFLAVPLVGSQLHKMGANLVTDLPASFFDLGAWGWPTILALGLSTVMSFFTSMDSYTRCIAAKDARTARTGTIYAAVLVLIIAGTSTFLGMAGKLILPDLSSSNNVIAALVVELFPHGLKGLVLIGVLSAIMSTADISVLTGSASLTKDIYQRYINPNASDKTLLRVGFVASLLVGVLGAIFGWFTQDIMNILLITFTINSAGLFLPTLGAFFWKKSCSTGAFASMLSATVIAVVWFIGGKVSSLPLFSIDALWPSFGVSAILYVVICLTHHQTPAEQKKAERFYAAK